MSCSRSEGRQSRHSEVNEITARASRSALIPCIREPAGLLRTDGKRPDGLTLIPFERGKVLVWDATITDTLAPSNQEASASSAGSAARKAERLKTNKYAQLANEFIFVPLVFETLGGPGPEAWSLLQKIGKQIELATGEKRALEFLLQRLSLAVQRGNAAAIMGTMRGCLEDKLDW